MTHEEIMQFSRDNWNKISPEMRQRCIDFLRIRIPTEKLPEWKIAIQLKTGAFHHFGGMQIRNLLRQVILDKDLPGVKYKEYPDEMHNWDDFYMGALEELLKDV